MTKTILVSGSAGYIGSHASKRVLEEDMRKDFGALHGMTSAIFRYFNVAGADQNSELGENHCPGTAVLQKPPLIQDSHGEALGLRGWMTKLDPARYRTTNWNSYNAALILGRGGTAIIPVRKNGRRWREDCPVAIARNEILRATQRLGRTIWKRWSGYQARSRIKAKMISQVLSNLWRSPVRPQGLRRTHRITRPRPSDRQNPHPCGADKPVQRARPSLGRTRGMGRMGKR